MSNDKPPSALSIPQSVTNLSNNSPRSLGTSILNGSHTGPNSANASSLSKLNTPPGNNGPPQQHALPNPNIPSPQQQHPQSYPSHGPQFSPYGNDNSGYMQSQSQPPYIGVDFHQHHLSQGQPPTPQTATSGSNMNFPPQPPVLQPNYNQPHHNGFPPFQFPAPNGVSSPAGQPGVSGPMVHPTQQLLPLPQNTQLTPSPSPLTAVSAGGPQTPASATAAGGFGNQTFDTTGQHAPPGMKPRVTATLWEDEGSLCFQVEAKGVCVARREDNHMINGTKLLNVAGMTRGRRDGILKSEKVRHVVKIGPMHLKGVWIPFDRALDFANKEKITELLYPLFVHNIGALLYHPANTHRTHAVVAAAERRKQDNLQNQMQQQRRGPSELISSPHPPPLHHHHGMQGGMQQPHHLAPHNLAQGPHQINSRPGIERSLSFPTPPSSASSVMGGVNPDGSFWNGGNMVQGGPGSQPLAIDTVMNSRSMPTTPATTPPGGAIQQLQSYPPPQYASGIPQNNPIAQQNMQRFGQPLPQPTQYMNQNREASNMGPPPTARGPPASLSRPSSRQNNAEEVHPKEEGGEEQNGLEQEYTHDANNYPGGHRSGNNYYPPLNADHAPHLSPEINGSPNHGGQAPSTPVRSYGTASGNVPRTIDGGSGATPRTAPTASQSQWVQNPHGYSTPPRAATNGGRQAPPQRNLYQLVSGDAAADQHNGSNGAGAPDSGYPGQGLGVSIPAQTPQQPYSGMNGSSTPSSNKRMRMEDEDENGSRPSSRGHDERPGGDSEGGLKRRKTIREGSTPVIGGAGSAFDRNADGRLNRTRSAVQPTRAAGRR
ncbi:uncharacterized protein H6S33_005500 [Morchella sextelata]|uniref:uncharacterized protein n=1 Tax=Morchella sextelata TaxID=1174677 RepID=UPI001D058C0F|nr:uncharacterized protein H6S33_005500 [Morchella sextelata]KAH0613614.1 hypothetical protein H6S33_005500 [Morchella sextelata]